MSRIEESKLESGDRRISKKHEEQTQLSAAGKAIVFSLLALIVIIFFVLLAIISVNGILIIIGAVVSYFYVASEVVKKAESAFETLREVADATFLFMLGTLDLVILQGSLKLVKASNSTFRAWMALSNLITLAVCACVPHTMYVPLYGFREWMTPSEESEDCIVAQSTSGSGAGGSRKSATQIGKPKCKHRKKVRRPTFILYLFWVAFEIFNTYPLVWLLVQIKESLTTILYVVVLYIVVVFVNLITTYERLTDRKFSDLLKRLQNDLESFASICNDEVIKETASGDDDEEVSDDEDFEADESQEKMKKALQFVEKMTQHTVTSQYEWRFIYLAYCNLLAPSFLLYSLITILECLAWDRLSQIAIATLYALILAFFLLANCNFALRVLAGRVKGVKDPGSAWCSSCDTFTRTCLSCCVEIIQIAFCRKKTADLNAAFLSTHETNSQISSSAISSSKDCIWSESSFLSVLLDRLTKYLKRLFCSSSRSSSPARAAR